MSSSELSDDDSDERCRSLSSIGMCMGDRAGAAAGVIGDIKAGVGTDGAVLPAGGTGVDVVDGPCTADCTGD